ncbi:hypothetical protein NMG60_11028384 [Bertholletia excelsa]
MEFFRVAETVRLRSIHDKYLLADNDKVSVCQDRCGSSRRARWTVELVDDVENVVRLRSCYGKYLTAIDEQYLMGVTGRKVSQTLPQKLDSKLEWEPIREDHRIRLRTRYGNYLRANGGLPPWRNSITHDIPHRHHDWVLWQIDVLRERPKPMPAPEDESVSDLDPWSPTFNLRSPKLAAIEASEPAKSEGRMIYFNVAGDEGSEDEGTEETCFLFKGHNLEELTVKLEEETGLDNIMVCSRNPLNGKLYPLRLALPPNNAGMHVVVVPHPSEG